MLSRDVHEKRSTAAARWAAAFIASLVALGSLALGAAPASAHDELTSATPAADESVSGLPAEVRLTFSGVLSPEEGATAIEVLDEADESLVSGAPVVEENTVTQALDAASGASGTIRVLWRVVSSDGHPISGEYSFSVTGAPAPTPTETTTAEPTTPATTEPTQAPSATPTAPADEDDADSTFADVWLWVVLGVLAAAVAGALLYLAIARVRRENALRERGAQDDGPGSEPPADR